MIQSPAALSLEHQADPLAALDRVADGCATAADLAWLAGGLTAWRVARGAIPLERALRLPSAPARLRQAERNRWLAHAARQLATINPGAGPEQLHAELKNFARSAWPAWRGNSLPPPGSSRLRESMFHALRLGRGRVLSVKQLRRIVGTKPPLEMSGRVGHAASVATIRSPTDEPPRP